MYIMPVLLAHRVQSLATTEYHAVAVNIMISMSSQHFESCSQSCSQLVWQSHDKIIQTSSHVAIAIIKGHRLQ